MISSTQKEKDAMTITLTMYSTPTCGDCRRSKRWLDEHNVPYAYIDITEHPDAADYVFQLNEGIHIVPTIVFPDGSILAEPSNDALAEHVRRVLGIE
jgi:glutaredoxin